MAVSVRIEDEAFSDERYDDLAQAAGLADADHARGKMARLWRQCTLEQTHELLTTTVVRILGPNAVAALEISRLGERVDDTRVRIRGTVGRIEWLKRLRDNGKFGRKGGRPKRNPRGFPPPNPTGGASGSENETPPAPAPAPAPTKKNGESARGRAKTQVPADWLPADHLALLASERDQLERFRDHHRSKGNAFVDIEAAWRNWKRRAHEFSPNQASPMRARDLTLGDEPDLRGGLGGVT